LIYSNLILSLISLPPASQFHPNESTSPTTQTRHHNFPHVLSISAFIFRSLNREPLIIFPNSRNPQQKKCSSQRHHHPPQKSPQNSSVGRSPDRHFASACVRPKLECARRPLEPIAWRVDRLELQSVEFPSEFVNKQYSSHSMNWN
jgi:hypothetical protein